MSLRTLVSRRFAHNCLGCGMNLLVPLSRSTGSKGSSQTSSVQAQHNDRAGKLLQQFSIEQLQALNWKYNDSEMIENFELSKQKVSNSTNKALNSAVCKPCVMARNGSITPIEIPHPPQDIMGVVFRVIDALDFPLGIPMSSTVDAPTHLSIPKNEVFVINRCDLLVSHASQLPKLKSYFMRTFFESHSISADRVILVSATRKWHLSKLSEMFVSKPKENYFVGSTLAGKTRLVHELAGVSQTSGATYWPLPFTTQKSTSLKSLPEYRSKMLVDTPSESNGSSSITQIIPNVLRKTCSGIRMSHKDPKYTVPIIKAKTGQVVSIGGLAAVEFPRINDERQVNIHVYAGIGGLAHTEYARVFSSMEKLREINSSTKEHHLKMRMHDNIDLKIEPKLKICLERSKATKTSVVIKNLGFLQPHVFGNLPQGYEATVWAPKGTEVGLRPEILGNL